MPGYDDEKDRAKLDQCAAWDLHPKVEPLGDDHHTSIPFNQEDSAVGDALAYFLGTLFADVQDRGHAYWYSTRTSVDEWRRVARALRIHGLMIADRKEPS